MAGSFGWDFGLTFGYQLYLPAFYHCNEAPDTATKEKRRGLSFSWLWRVNTQIRSPREDSGDNGILWVRTKQSHLKSGQKLKTRITQPHVRACLQWSKDCCQATPLEAVSIIQCFHHGYHPAQVNLWRQLSPQTTDSLGVRNYHTLG